MANTKKPKPVAKHKAFTPQVHVRMYLQGLGDCFLLRFETKKDAFFDILIDCGIYKASPDAGAIMNQVVDDVIATTGNRLDILVSTHEHWDHISGFAQAHDKFEKMKIGQVWQAWTEDPKNPLANQLRNKYENAKLKLVGLMRGAHAGLAAAASSAPLDDAFNVMGFFGVTKDDNDKDNGDAYAAIKKLMASKNPRYCAPGDVLDELESTGVKAFVLGPPASEAILRQQNIAKGDAYQKQALAFFDGLEGMLGAVEAGTETDADLHRLGCPFDGRLGIPVDIARQSEFFQTLYGFEPDHPDAFRSIDDLAHDALNQLALRMDNYTNNTSLVLAFLLPSGKVLLFPGDAQGGNWKSWADLETPLAFAAEKTDAHKLLASTIFYKVGHHGSHNATPRSYGLELMTNPELRALVPVDHQIAQLARYGEMPLVAIMSALKTKTAGAVFRSDGDSAEAPKVFKFADKQLTIRTAKDGKPLKRPLYCETSFDLD